MSVFKNQIYNIMKKRLISLAVVLPLFFGGLQAQITNPLSPHSESASSCYRILSSKKFKKACLQRDSLYNLSQRLIADTTTMTASIERLTQKNNECDKNLDKLQKDYNALLNASADKATRLNETIDQKNQELLEREKRISEISDALLDREKRVSQLEQQLQRQDSLANALNNTLKQALLGFNSDDLQLEMKNGKVYVSLFDKLLFKSGKVDVEKAGQDALRVLANVLKNTDIDIVVEGHTDNIPIKTAKYADNWDLSAARANNIVRLLTQSFGVNPQSVNAAARAEFLPIATNDTPEGRAKNRRTEIILTPNLGDLYNIINRE